MYSFLEGHNLLPEEQKGCRRNSNGTADLLFLDKMIPKEVKSRKKNLAMGWIDYRKANDMFPHSWIIECLEKLEINGKVQILLKESMKKWKVELTCGKQELGEVNIKRGIFQGPCLLKQVETKELEKSEKYQYLAWELKKLWNMSMRIIPIVIDVLGTTP